MAAFEYGVGTTPGSRRDGEVAEAHKHEEKDPRYLREENLVAFKIYDNCRWQACLTGAELGPARAACAAVIDDAHYTPGEVIIAPSAAVCIKAEDLRITGITVVGKRPSPFKRGYWDVDLKFTFEYLVVLLEADGAVLGSLPATSVFNKKLTLFGSTGGENVIATDLFHAGPSDTVTLNADPFIMAEAKAVLLDAVLTYVSAPHAGNAVFVTLGLFAVTQLFRIVELSVESRGFAIPPECEDCAPVNPCEFFSRLDFPMDAFAPPQKPEFMSGYCGDIPRGKREA